MKGQFMLMSSIVIGIILISASSSISGIKSDEIETSTFAYDVNTIKNEASRINLSEEDNRENFRKMVESMDYQTDMDYWESQNCFNITLQDDKTDLTINCVS